MSILNKHNNCIVTGGAGFIGHHLVNFLLENTVWKINIIDNLSYASYGFRRLEEINALNNKRIRIFTNDLSNSISEGITREIGPVDFIFHLAGETFVERSISNPLSFVSSNLIGTANLLEFAKKQDNLKYFIFVSTDEVFGEAREGECFKEWDRYNSRNPYSATKAGAEELILAYSNTYSMPILVLHSMNVIGIRQHMEKYIPKLIRYILEGKKIPIHADITRAISGSRFYLHQYDLMSAIFFLIENSKKNVNNNEINWHRDKFNIVGERRIENLEMAQFVAKVLDKSLEYELVDFHSERPGHDLHYCLDGSRMFQLGWKPKVNVFQKIEEIVNWTLDNKYWLLP